MIILDSTLKSLEVILSASVVTQLPIVGNWVDINITGVDAVVGNSDNTLVTNDTTAVIAVSAPATSVIRQIKFLSIRNINGASVIVKVQVNNNGTKRIIASVSLAQDDTLTYNDGRGFQVFNSNGEQKESQILVNLTSQVTGVLPVPNGGSGAATLTGIVQGNGASAFTAITLPADGTKFLDGTGAFSTPAGGDNSVVDFRLTLTTGVPVTPTDVTGATTIYCSPYKGNRIALYNGSSWNIRTSAEFSLALGTLTSGKPYDVFCYDNSGVPTLEFLAWTNDTTRATALVLQNGVLSKSGAVTRRYLGTFYTTATTTTEDSVVKRFLYNYYNRIDRTLQRYETTANWNYSTATVRQANAAGVGTANQVEIIQGVAETSVDITLSGVAVSNNSGGAVNTSTGIGEDTTTAYTVGTFSQTIAAGTVVSSPVVRLTKVPTIGHHTYSWNEWSAATPTTTFYGATVGVGSSITTGLSGTCKA